MNNIKKPYKTLPVGLPYGWESDYGEDEYGIWAAFTYKGIRLAFRWVLPGEFQMGSPENEPGREENESQHKVILTKGFWLAETACTQALWEAVMGYNPSHFKGDQLPIEMVSWNDCQEFIGKINELVPGLNLRLPTEAEWEYACRAGTTTPFSFGENITTDQVNYIGYYPYNNGPKGRFRKKTVEVESLPCNPWGLYEMHGNIWELCQDGEREYGEGTAIDPIGKENGVGCVIRGGGWFGCARFARSACRDGIDLANPLRDVGFRLVHAPGGK